MRAERGGVPCVGGPSIRFVRRDFLSAVRPSTGLRPPSPRCGGEKDCAAIFFVLSDCGGRISCQFGMRASAT